MRLFVAADLGDSARAAIAEAQARLRAHAPQAALRWVRPEHLHLTLVFLGEIDAARLPAAADALTPPVGQRPFEMELAGLGIFPPHGLPRALWLGIRSDGHIRALQRELADRLDAAGFAPGDRSFNPHLTLARWRSARARDRRQLLSAVLPNPVARARIDHATLYESRLSSTGPAYTERARANLGGLA
jgi:2'-5' RNA ligase